MWDHDRFVCMTPAGGEARFAVLWLARGEGDSMWVAADGRIRRTSQRRWVADVNDLKSIPDWWAKLGVPSRDGRGGFWLIYQDWGLAHIDQDGRLAKVSTSDGLPSHRLRCSSLTAKATPGRATIAVDW
jgi:hypothetical protein